VASTPTENSRAGRQRRPTRPRSRGATSPQAPERPGSRGAAPQAPARPRTRPRSFSAPSHAHLQPLPLASQVTAEGSTASSRSSFQHKDKVPFSVQRMSLLVGAWIRIVINGERSRAAGRGYYPGAGHRQGTEPTRDRGAPGLRPLAATPPWRVRDVQRTHPARSDALGRDSPSRRWRGAQSSHGGGNLEAQRPYVVIDPCQRPPASRTACCWTGDGGALLVTAARGPASSAASAADHARGNRP